MAKKKSGGPNKSQAIRDYFAAHPDAKPKEAAEELSKQGLSVTPGFASTIRSNSKTKKSGKRGRPSKSTAGRSAANKSVRGNGRSSNARRASPAGEVSIDSLVKVKRIVDEMGGVEDARNALTALEKLRD